MTNSRTGKKTLFPIFPSMARTSHSDFEAGPVSELENGDVLEMEIFDNTRAVFSFRQKINGDFQPGKRLLVRVSTVTKGSGEATGSLPRVATATEKNLSQS